MVFSHLATVEWGLTQYRDSASLLRAIRNVSYIGSITNLNDALYLTRTQVFAPGSGTRPSAVKVTIILTDGEDNVPEEGTPLTIANATLCKREGIRLIAIGVSDKVDISRLLQIVSTQADYHGVDDFDALPSVIAQLQPEQICFPTPLPPEPSTPTPSPPGPGRRYRTFLKNIVVNINISIHQIMVEATKTDIIALFLGEIPSMLL